MTELVFIAPLRHPDTTNSWGKISSLLGDTLKSVCGQDNPDFQVIVVCNKQPVNIPEHPNVTYLQVDYPPPATIDIDKGGLDFIQIDKGTKMVAGLIHARIYKPRYVMFFDADDLVSNRLCSFLKQTPESHGWYVSHGYLLVDANNKMYNLDNFQEYCGTCNILNFKVLPEIDLSDQASQTEILQSVNHKYLKFALGGHRVLHRFQENIGKPMKQLPFPGAVYRTEHGSNVSQVEKTLNDSMQEIPISKEMQLEFGLPY